MDVQHVLVRPPAKEDHARSIRHVVDGKPWEPDDDIAAKVHEHDARRSVGMTPFHGESLRRKVGKRHLRGVDPVQRRRDSRP
jgi:hypothetical protein